MSRLRTAGLDNITGQHQFYLGGDTVMGSPSLVIVEVNLGTQPIFSGTFDITVTGLTIGRTIIIDQACGPYTGKGTLADEAEMDTVIVTGYIFSSTIIRCYWNSPTLVGGNIKFSYQVITSS